MTRRGKPVRLRRPIKRGGEGTIYDVDVPNRVAKIYHDPSGRRDKVLALAAMHRREFNMFAAWPEEPLFKDNDLVGFIMPRIRGHDVHKLYSPKSRKTAFPKADYRFLVRVAGNIARAFGAFHECGCVVGDVNHGSIFVDQDATVKLLDCDSFQIVHEGRRFPCEVGVLHFTPPELQGVSFGQIVRTPNHDCFGLAVLIFHILMMGRHPYSGRFRGSGEMPIEKAISESRYAFSRVSDQLLPPRGMSHQMVPPSMAQLFDLAFQRNDHRPTAAEWVASLDELEELLVQCDNVPQHYHQRGNICRWCEYEQVTGVALFGNSYPIERLLEKPIDRNRLDVDGLMVRLNAVHPQEKLPYQPPRRKKPQVPVHFRRQWRQSQWSRNIAIVSSVLVTLTFGTGFAFTNNYVGIFLLLLCLFVIWVGYRFVRVGSLSELAAKRTSLRKQHIDARNQLDKLHETLIKSFSTARLNSADTAAQLKGLYGQTEKSYVEGYLRKKREEIILERMKDFSVAQCNLLLQGQKAGLISAGVVNASQINADLLQKVRFLGNTGEVTALLWRDNIYASLDKSTPAVRVTRKIVMAAQAAKVREEMNKEAHLIGAIGRLEELNRHYRRDHEKLRETADRKFLKWQESEDLYHSVRLHSMGYA